MNKIISVLIGINFLVLTGCSTNAPVTSKKVGSVTKEQVVTIKKGTVTSIKNVAIQGKTSNAGRTVGSVTGSIIGSAVPYGGILGSLIGGAVGGETEKAASKKAGYEISLELEGGDKVVVTQLAETKFKTGDKVRLIITDNVARVAHLQDNS